MQGQPTADLAHFCATLRCEGLPSTVRERVRYLLLDHLAVTLRGSMPPSLPSSLATYQMLETMNASTTKGTSLHPC